MVGKIARVQLVGRPPLAEAVRALDPTTCQTIGSPSNRLGNAIDEIVEARDTRLMEERLPSRAGAPAPVDPGGGS